MYVFSNYSDGFDIPTEEDAQGRSLGTLAGSLKFWNWSAIQSFRRWIQERRSRTTTLTPIPVYIVNNPHEPQRYYPSQYI